MDGQVMYAELNVSRNSDLKNSSPPSVPQGVCQGPCWHQLALKVVCAGLVLLFLAVIGLSVSVISLKLMSSSTNSCTGDVQDVQKNRNETTERPSLLKCPTDWILLREKCLVFISSSTQNWTNSLADCLTKEAILLLIQDQEELTLIQHQLPDEGLNFWIGLNFTLSEKKWKWINGSFLNSNILQINGEEKENNCAYISKTKVVSGNCAADINWICQNKLKHQK
ncbi:killer cell lectin-like receptor subfamily B member 1 [Talpa occidentalis]|uniref:killer cell lectin-like receptor subfamily B member 1 n=1 Tax=Talpa occidentalis TaxID=50954 RepID=UPI00188F063A|nr:killer cell lectin-like receptor subfamily B member 1 [Talpa occidentalis]